MGISPFESVMSIKPRKPIDLVPLPPDDWPSTESEGFAKHIHDIQVTNFVSSL